MVIHVSSWVTILLRKLDGSDRKRDKSTIEISSLFSFWYSVCIPESLPPGHQLILGALTTSSRQNSRENTHHVFWPYHHGFPWSSYPFLWRYLITALTFLMPIFQCCSYRMKCKLCHLHTKDTRSPNLNDTYIWFSALPLFETKPDSHHHHLGEAENFMNYSRSLQKHSRIPQCWTISVKFSAKQRLAPDLVWTNEVINSQITSPTR